MTINDTIHHPISINLTEGGTAILKNEHEIDDEIKEIKKILFNYDTVNAENFTKQIIRISNRSELLKIVNSLKSAKDLYNHIRLKGEYKLLERLDFKNFSRLYKVASGRLNYINQRSSREKNDNVRGLLNLALLDLEAFSFIKIGEKELKLADQFKDLVQKVINEERNNIDHNDPIYISLKEELERILKLKDIKDISNEIMEKNSKNLEKVILGFKELNRKDQLLSDKYMNDGKYVRLHKDLLRSKRFGIDEPKLFNAINDLKKNTDIKIIENSNVLENENFVETMMSRIIYDTLKDKHNLNIDKESTEYINRIIRKEYINEYNGNLI